MKNIILIIFMTLFINANSNSSLNLWDYNISSPSPTNNIMETIEQKTPYKFESSYDDSLIKAKAEDRYIFLLITEEFCQWCEKLIDIVLQDERVVTKLNSDYVGVIVDRNKGFYPSNIGITGVPSIFIINPKNGEIVTSMVGYHDVDFYLKWFRYVDNERNR